MKSTAELYADQADRYLVLWNDLRHEIRQVVARIDNGSLDEITTIYEALNKLAPPLE